MSSSVDEASKYAQQLAFCSWRFDVWHKAGDLTYQLIDAALEAGLVRPGATVEEVQAAVLQIPRRREEE